MLDGDKVFYVGTEPGQGAVVKTVNQLLCGVHIAVAAECLSLAGKVGVERAIAILAAEFDEALALAGVRSLGDITPDFVRARALT